MIAHRCIRARSAMFSLAGATFAVANLVRPGECESRPTSHQSTLAPHIDSQPDHSTNARGSPCVFAGSGHPELAREVARELGVELGELKLGHFADGETQIQILNSVRGKDVYIIQPTCSPINDNLIELLLMISTFRRSSAATITAVIPYFGYARQDRICEDRETVAAADVAHMLETAGVDRVVAVDLHRGQLEGFFSPQTHVDNLDALVYHFEHFLNLDLVDPVILCPSSAGVARAKKFRDLLVRDGIHASLAFVAPMDNTGILDQDLGHHHRVSDETEHILVGKVKHSDVVIVDDMIDTGSRLATAAATAKRFGANRVFAYATHGLFSNECMEVIDKAPVTEVVVSGTIPIKQDKISPKVIRLSVAPLIAEAIRRSHRDQSLTILTTQSNVK